ncbi:MAG TPA: O-antigen ligase family protein [Gallionellaceae bacterium]|nr:O-antigen ligase family protein [Gallionellaceae bacterium]
MPEYLRALLYLLLLSTVFFAFVDRPAVTIIGRSHFSQRRNLWFGLTLAAFLAPSYWVYAFIAVPLLIYANRRESNPTALFFFILFALPVATFTIPGGGLINYLFELSHARMLALVILLPAFFFLIRQSDTLPFGRSGAEKLLAAYLLLTVILYLRETTITDTLRQIFYLFVDVFLPFFVISRSLKNLQTFKNALMSLVIAIMVLAPIAVFESFRDWLLYKSLFGILALNGGMTGYLGRDGMLRVSASVGHPIALGYLMVVGMGFYLFLQGNIQQKFIRRFGMALLAAGLIAPLSRGPWVGASVLFIVFIATGRKPVRRLMGLALAGLLALLLISTLPGGERVINLLPFIGTTEKINIDYRENLITNSMIVIQRNPWFGSIDYLKTPEMLALYEGGIIDVVNTFIAIALEQGFVGLGLFVGFFAVVVIGVRRAMRSIADRESDEYLLGRVLLATLLAILVIIVTVSSISIIPIVYWSVAGLGVAYAQMVRKLSDNNDLIKDAYAQ